MQQHNPHSHSILCQALQVTLDAFDVRDVSSDEVERVEGCPGCQCRVLDDAPAASLEAPSDEKTAEAKS